jgi:hypothetical protein
MKIYFNLAEFSYSELPKLFSNIFGVTGTLSKNKEAKFRSEYKI